VNFVNKDDFLVRLNDHCLIRYLETAAEVRIPDYAEKIDSDCFYSCNTICSVDFGCTSKVVSIGALAFASAECLKMITIPSSVTFIGRSCFNLSRVQVVRFAPDSKLEELGVAAFANMPSVESIVLPRGVKTIGPQCFTNCQKLQISPFSLDSTVVRIGELAFLFCVSLTSMWIPASVESVGECCFQNCDALSSLTFGSPSHLRELLDLPSQLSGFLEIPDSVEILGFYDDGEDPPRTLICGPDSRLSEFRPTLAPWVRVSRSFLQASATTLKRFRTKLEFALRTGRT
jgi:hypothetical protein